MSLFPDVRLAVEKDRDQILHLCRTLHEENGIFPLDESKIVNVLDRAFNENIPERDAIIGVIGNDNELFGCIGIAMHSLWYTYRENQCLDELWNIVHPNYRKSNYAKQMILFAKYVADKLRIPLLIGVLSNERTEAKVRLYESLLPNSGAYFVYDPGNPIDPKEKKPNKYIQLGNKVYNKIATMIDNSSVEEVESRFDRLCGEDLATIRNILKKEYHAPFANSESRKRANKRIGR